MDIKLEDLHGQGGSWYRAISAEGFVFGEIMQVMTSVNRVIGWTFKKYDDGPCKMHRTYKSGKDALAALVKSCKK